MSLGIDGQTNRSHPLESWPATIAKLWNARAAVIAAPDSPIALFETPENKRRWTITPKDTGGGALTFEIRAKDAINAWLAKEAEASTVVAVRPGDVVRGTGVAMRMLERSHVVELARMMLAESEAVETSLSGYLVADGLPYLSTHRFTEEGIAKHAEWQHTWDLQRREDAGEKIHNIPVPPKYAQGDYRSATYWQLRGPLDVPKERFISYPGCESDQDHEPVYGWAGWDHEQRAKALATLYWNRKTEESWAKDRLTPMLAGLLELLPWLKQWHNAASDDYAGDSPANYYAGFLDAECRAFGLTHDDLRAWRPAEKTRGKKAAPKPVEDDAAPEDTPKPAPKKRGKKAATEERP